MSTINKTIKRQLAIQMVTDAIERRVKNLHEDALAHWSAIVNEIMHNQAIEDANAIVTAIRTSDNIALVMEALDIDYNSWSKPTVMEKHHVRTIDEIGSRFNDPLNLMDNLNATKNCGYDDGERIRKEITKMWKILPQFRVALPIPLLVIAEDEDDKGCTIDDPNALPSNTLDFDTDSFVPEDCTTSKRFNRRAGKLGGDASKLFSNIMDSIALARTDTAIIDIIPEMKPYLDALSTEHSKVSNLLHSVQDGE